MGSAERDEEVAATQGSAEETVADQPVRPGSPRTISRTRWILVNSLLGFTTLLLIVGIFAIWANRLLFSPENFSNTSTQLLANPAIRASTANYVVDQLYANVNVAGVIKSGLPPRFQRLAGPAAGALRNVAVQGVELALTRPRIQSLWAQSTRAADQTFIAIVKGGKGAVGTNNGVVTLNLAPVVDNVASRLGLPSDIAAKLPPNIANLTILKSDQLKLVQNVGNAIQGLALWLTIFVPLLYALAIVLVPGRRRRMLMNVGIAGVLAGVLVLLGRSLLVSQVPGSLTDDASLRPTIEATISIMTGILSEAAGACIVVGIPLILAGWFAGPSRIARTGREAIAPFLRERPAESYAIVLAVMALIFIWNPIPSTGKPVGILVYTLLALFGMFVLRRQTAEEFPDARLGAATQKLRARWERMRHRREQSKAPPPTPQSTIPTQLQQLAELRDNGAISADEYQVAKEQLLHS
jgi:Short C-terminal domain